MTKDKATTKLCKHCKTEIPYDAKVCPNCRKKQGGKGLIIAIAIIAVIIICAAVGGSDDDSNNPKKVSSGSGNKTSENTTDGSVQDTFNVGDTVDLKNIKTTLVSVVESVGSEYNKPSDGNVFVLCEFEIENSSDSDISVSSIMSFEAYCDDYSINESLSAALETDKNTLDGTIAAGKKMNGVIAYEVPAGWSDIEIDFTPDFWGKSIKFIATK